MLVQSEVEERDAMNVMNVVSSPSLATSPMYFDYQTRLPLSSPRSEVMYLKPTANNLSVPQGHVGCHTSFTGPVTSTTDTPTNRMSIIQVREIALLHCCATIFTSQDSQRSHFLYQPPTPCFIKWKKKKDKDRQRGPEALRQRQERKGGVSIRRIKQSFWCSHRTEPVTSTQIGCAWNMSRQAFEISFRSLSSHCCGVKSLACVISRYISYFGPLS